MDLWDVLAWIALAVAALWVVLALSVLNLLLKLRLQAPGYDPVDAGSLPPHLEPLYRSTRAELEGLGFEALGYLKVRGLERLAPERSPALLFRHPMERAFALLSAAEAPEPARPCRVTFRTFLAGGRSVLTLNGLAHTVVGEPPDTRLVDPYATTLLAQWQAHRAAVAGSGGAALAFGPAGFAAAESLEGERYLALLERTGRARARADGGGHELGIGAALRAALRILGGLGRARRAQIAAAPAAPPVDPGTLVEEEAIAFLRQQALRALPSRRLFLVWLFVATLAAFIGYLATQMSAAWIAAITVVVFVHELGHFLAMKAFGYRDPTIFFLPFLGAATAGEKPDATVREEVLVLLAGPMPGLLLGLVLLAVAPASGSPVLTAFAWTFLAINLFNLLPVYPLDGGRIVHRLLLAGSAVADLLFRVLALAALGYFAYRTGDRVLLVVAVVLALALPTAFRTERLRRRLPAGGAAGLEAARRIFRTIHAGGHGALPWSRKLVMARALREGYHAPRAAPGPKVAWLGTYALCLAGGIGATVVVAQRAGVLPRGPAFAERTLEMVHPCEESLGGGERFALGDAVVDAGRGDERRTRVSRGRQAVESDLERGRWVTVRVACEAPEPEAIRLGDALESYLHAGFPFLKPPWLQHERSRAAEDVARQTYRTLVAHMAKEGLGPFPAGAPGGGDRARRAAESLLAGPGARRLDGAVARAFVRSFDSDPATRATALAELGRRMGQLPLAPGPLGTGIPTAGALRTAVHGGKVRRDGPRLEISALSFADLAAGLHALSEYLCEARCSPLRYVLAEVSLGR
jgi:Zn-dependent protease